MHEQRFVPARLVRVHQRRQFVEVDLDLLGQVLRFRARAPNAAGDRLADEAHFAVREVVLLGKLERRQRGRRDDRFHLRHVLAEEDAALRAGGPAQPGNPGMRHRRAEERNLALPGQDHVRDEGAAAMQVARVLLAQHARAETLAGLAVGHCFFVAACGDALAL